MINKIINTIKTIKNLITDPLGTIKLLWQKIIDLKNQILKAGVLGALILIVSYFTIWWAGAVVAFLYVAFTKEMTPKEAFAIGTTAGITVWAGYAGWLHAANDGILAAKISELISKGAIDGSNILQITGILGGFICGMAAMTGAYAREWLYDTRIRFGWKW
jgi:uncharacterized membrane protein